MFCEMLFTEVGSGPGVPASGTVPHPCPQLYPESLRESLRLSVPRETSLVFWGCGVWVEGCLDLQLLVHIDGGSGMGVAVNAKPVSSFIL